MFPYKSSLRKLTSVACLLRIQLASPPLPHLRLGLSRRDFSASRLVNITDDITLVIRSDSKRMITQTCCIVER
jgi:hypothetical protein